MFSYAHNRHEMSFISDVLTFFLIKTEFVHKTLTLPTFVPIQHLPHSASPLGS